MATPPVVTLLTDFGSTDAYVAAMKGTLLSVNPHVTIVDITHEVRPGDIRQGAFLLGAAFPAFPPGTVHVAVVDPGVGSSRRAVALATGSATFVAPDNGLLSFVLEALSPGVWDLPSPGPLELRPLVAGLRAVVLTEERFWRRPVSQTFHGRDIFAPVAAHLAAGVPLEELGPATDRLLSFPVPRARRQADGSLAGEVLAVDRFGNLITSVREGELPPDPVEVEIGGRTLRGLSRSYVEAQGLLAVVGSLGYLEVALRDGSATEALGLGVGAGVRVRALVTD